MKTPRRLVAKLRKRAARMASLVTVLLAAGAGCAELLVDDFQYGSLEVVATSSDGVPAEGVRLILHRVGEHLDYGTTDARGRHLFELVPSGRLGVFATLPARFTSADSLSWIAVDEIRMDQGEHHLVELSVFYCSSQFQVRVIDDEGEPIAGVAVDLYQSEGVLFQDTTDVDGRVLFTDGPCGNSGVRIRVPEGYSVPSGPGGSYVDGLLTGDGDLIEVEFVLTRL